MESLSQAESPAATDELMRDFKVALRPTRATGELVAHIAISRPTLTHEVLEVEDVTPDFEYPNGDVLVLRFDLVHEPGGRGKHRISRSHAVEDGMAFEYVVLMYGAKAGPLKLAAVKIIEDG